MTRASGRAGSARALAPGTAEGEALVLEQPLSFWGGTDPATGRIIDRHHPQAGALVAGRIVVMPFGRGSSSSSTVLAEALRRGTGPAGIVLLRPDPILALGSVVAAELYGRQCPIVVLPEDAYRSIATGDRVTVEADGEGAAVRVEAGPAQSSPR